MMFSPDNYTETDALIYDLQQEVEKYRGQLVTLFERISGCDISEFTDDQVSYLADMIEGQMDADEGAISKVKKENAELREALKVMRKGYSNLIGLHALPNSEWDEAAQGLIKLCDGTLNK